MENKGDRPSDIWGICGVPGMSLTVAKEAAVPPVVADVAATLLEMPSKEAAVPPVAAEVAAMPPEVPYDAATPPVVSEEAAAPQEVADIFTLVVSCPVLPCPVLPSLIASLFLPSG